MNIRNILKLSVVLSSLPFLVSCGEEATESDNVTINYFTQPVILEDTTYFPAGSDESVTIKGPWFRAIFYGTNSSKKEVVISSVTGEVTGNGQTVDWAPDFNATDDLLAIAPGESFQDLVATFGGLPESERPNYRVKIKFAGWFSLEDDPKTKTINEKGFPGENFKKVITFRVKAQ